MSLELFFIALLFIVLLGTILVVLNFVFGFKNKGNNPNQKIKKEIYECGIKSQIKQSSVVGNNFYKIAILFIIFDVEMIFLFPWIMVFDDFVKNKQGLYIFFVMMFFLAIFIIGLIWEIQSRVLSLRDDYGE